MLCKGTLLGMHLTVGVRSVLRYKMLHGFTYVAGVEVTFIVELMLFAAGFMCL